jgi:hypothetical protein
VLPLQIRQTFSGVGLEGGRHHEREVLAMYEVPFKDGLKFCVTCRHNKGFECHAPQATMVDLVTGQKLLPMADDARMGDCGIDAKWHEPKASAQ